jgi:hypothetical protein
MKENFSESLYATITLEARLLAAGMVASVDAIAFRSRRIESEVSNSLSWLVAIQLVKIKRDESNSTC